jgi:hypothetical protein
MRLSGVRGGGILQPGSGFSVFRGQQTGSKTEMLRLLHLCGILRRSVAFVEEAPLEKCRTG